VGGCVFVVLGGGSCVLWCLGWKLGVVCLEELGEGWGDGADYHTSSDRNRIWGDLGGGWSLGLGELEGFVWKGIF